MRTEPTLEFLPGDIIIERWGISVNGNTPNCENRWIFLRESTGFKDDHPTLIIGLNLKTWDTSLILTRNSDTGYLLATGFYAMRDGEEIKLW